MPGVCDSTYLDNSACAALAAIEAMDFTASLGGAMVRRGVCLVIKSSSINVSSLGDKAEFVLMRHGKVNHVIKLRLILSCDIFHE